MAVAVLTEADIELLTERAVRKALAALRGPELSMSSITVDQAAEMLGVRPKTIRCWARSGQLVGKKLGKSWRFTAADIQACRARPDDAALVEGVFQKLASR